MRATMIKFLMIFLTWSQVHGQEGSGSDGFLEDYTIEDNFIIEGSGENYEQSGDDDFCSEGSGSGEEEVLSVLQSASYSMSASDLIIDISLQRMSDDSVTMVCNVAETEGNDVEGSGATRASSSNFPAKLFLIRDVAVCADLSSAVGNDISTSAIELATVPGPVTDTAPISVTWDEVRQSNCVAMLKTSPVTEAEGSGEEEVIIEFRALTPRDCRRRGSGLILPNRLAGTRTFAVLNLAGFSLVAVGVTGAFAVVAAAAAAPSVSGSVPNFTDSYTLSNSILTVAPFALVFLVYHYMGLPLSRRRSDLRRRKGANPRIKSLSERIENVREDMTSIIRVLEPVRHFGEAYMEKLSRGPVGSLFRAGSYFMRRWDASPRHENRRNYEYNDYYY